MLLFVEIMADVAHFDHVGVGVNRSKTQRKMEAMEMYGSVYGSAGRHDSRQ